MVEPGEGFSVTDCKEAGSLGFLNGGGFLDTESVVSSMDGASRFFDFEARAKFLVKFSTSAFGRGAVGTEGMVVKGDSVDEEIGAGEAWVRRAISELQGGFDGCLWNSGTSVVTL